MNKHANLCCDELTGCDSTRQNAGTRARDKWLKALKVIAGPAVRLHHYRNLRAALLYDGSSASREAERHE